MLFHIQEQRTRPIRTDRALHNKGAAEATPFNLVFILETRVGAGSKER